LKDKVKKIDPDDDIQQIIEYTLKNKNFMDDLSVFECIENISEDNKIILERINIEKSDKDKLFQNFEILNKKYEEMKNGYTIMKTKIEELDSEIVILKRKNNCDLEFEKRLKSLENFRRDILDKEILK
jgi:hypothetical protein